MGDFGHDMYVWNSIGSSHQSHSKDGCTILLKLSQKVADDTEFVWIDTHNTAWHQGLVDGLSVMPMHSFGTEHIASFKWALGTQFTGHTHFNGKEIYFTDGVFEDEQVRYTKGSWIRSSAGSHHVPYSKRRSYNLCKDRAPPDSAP